MHFYDFQGDNAMAFYVALCIPCHSHSPNSTPCTHTQLHTLLHLPPGDASAAFIHGPGCGGPTRARLVRRVTQLGWLESLVLVVMELLAISKYYVSQRVITDHQQPLVPPGRDHCATEGCIMCAGVTACAHVHKHTSKQASSSLCRLPTGHNILHRKVHVYSPPALSLQVVCPIAVFVLVLLQGYHCGLLLPPQLQRTTSTRARRALQLYRGVCVGPAQLMAGLLFDDQSIYGSRGSHVQEPLAATQHSTAQHSTA